jgi:DNA-binding FadR family transcriptional regulator
MPKPKNKLSDDLPLAPRPAAVRRDAVSVVRLYIKDAGLQNGDQIPPERELAVILGVPRGKLRTALGRLKARGEIWQHVGKGTFVGETGREAASGALQAVSILDRTNPIEVLDARLMLEPRLAAMAALHGTATDFLAIGQLAQKGRAEKDYPASQRAGDAWHRSIAIAAHSALLLWLFDHLFTVRGAIHWGRLSPEVHDDDEGNIWLEHQQITEAISMRDAVLADRLMRTHLESLREKIVIHFR